MAIQAQERAAGNLSTLLQEADAAVGELVQDRGEAVDPGEGLVHDLGEADDGGTEVDADVHEQQVRGDAVDAETYTDDDEDNEEEVEGEPASQQAAPKKQRRKSHTKRLQLALDRLRAEADQHFAERQEAVLVANVLLAQRDEARQYAAQLEERLRDYGAEITSEQQELRRMRLEQQERELESRLRPQMQQEIAKRQQQAQQQAMVDELIAEADRLERVIGVPADYILLQYSQAKGPVTLEQVAKDVAKRLKVVPPGTRAAADKNRAAPRTGIVRSGASARTNTVPRKGEPGGLLSYAEGLVRDWRAQGG